MCSTRGLDVKLNRAFIQQIKLKTVALREMYRETMMIKTQIVSSAQSKGGDCANVTGFLSSGNGDLSDAHTSLDV